MKKYPFKLWNAKEMQTPLNGAQMGEPAGNEPEEQDFSAG